MVFEPKGFVATTTFSFQKVYILKKKIRIFIKLTELSSVE